MANGLMQNGKLQFGGLVTVVLAALAGAFTLGAHVGNENIHTPIDEKIQMTQAVVDRSVDREIYPELERIRKALESLDKKYAKLADK